MAIFRSLWPAEALPSIKGHGVYLRTPRLGDYEEWSALRAESRRFLAPWEPVWPEDDLTRAAFRRRVQRYAHDRQADLGYSFFVLNGSGMIVGGATLNNVRRGVAQAASLGYWIGERYARQGHMSAALAALVPFAHDVLRLKRIEAACLPHNTGSVRLLEKSRFTHEGHARAYLCIAGEWQDHLLFARLASDPLP
ncbi:MAG TPA: GNAT family protein [Xanthobacteraceae bacterium]|nr:GNAT family protein [Xanthobacteraceae bacterium]